MLEHDLSARGTVLGVLVAALALAGACQSSSSTPSTDVWAVVNGEEVTRDDVEKAFRRVVQPATSPTSEDEALTVKLGIVDELITQEVLLGRARALNLTVTDAEVDAAFNERKGNLTEDAFQQQLRERSLNDVDLKEALRRELLADKLIDLEVTSKITITDADIAAFYEANRANFSVAETQYRIAQIVVTPGPDPQLRNRLGDDATTPAAAQRKAQMLMQRLQQGGDFVQLAMDYSEDPQTAPQGGDLGFVPASALAQVPPQLRNAVLQSEPGSVNLVSAGGGHTLVLLVSKEPAGQRSLDTPGVRDNIRELLRGRKEQLLRMAYITSARGDAEITNYLARSIAQSQSPPSGLSPSPPGNK